MRIVFTRGPNNGWGSASDERTYELYYRDQGADKDFPMSYLQRVCEGKKDED